MRGIKPFKLSFVTRPFSWGQSHHLGVGVLGYFPLGGAPNLLTEMELWTETAKVLKDVALDVGIPKSRSEFLVVGSAHQPGGEPAPVRRVTVRVGSLAKSVDVIGDRRWDRDVPTAPAPFVSMPLSWDRAFGGAGFDRNPLGKGAAELKGPDGRPHVPLPNVEIAGRLIETPKDRPDPAGFGPIDFMWPQRFSLAGTYDKRWFETRFPGFAEDLDWRIWNLAAEDQRRDEPWIGDEAIVCENMHPTIPRLEGQLPGVRARCFVVQTGPEGRSFQEVPLKLTTIWLFPEIQRGVMVFHGARAVAEDDADDIETIMVAGERVGAEPRTLEHYQAALERRTGPERGLEVMNERDLMPDDLAGLGSLGEAMQQTTHDGLRRKRARKALEKTVAESRAGLEAMGLDPDKHGMAQLEPEPEMPALDQLSETMRTLIAEGEKKRAEMQADMQVKLLDLKKLCEDTGMSYEAMLEEMETPPRGPPDFTADRQRAKVRTIIDETKALGHSVDELEHYATDEDAYAMWKKAEGQLADLYRQGAQFQRPAHRTSPELSAERRAAVEAAHRRGESLAGWDLTGVDLSGIDLRGANLHRAFLESTDLSAATLDGADLSEAVLAHARLAGASLEGANLAGANLGRAMFQGARLVRAVLRDAILTGIDLRNSDLGEAMLDGATIDEGLLDGARLRGASLASTTFRSVSLRHVSFSGAKLDWAMFASVDLSGLDFSGASLENAAFYKVCADGARFMNARGKSLRVVSECSFARADLRGATFDSACFRGTKLAGADLSGGSFNGADFSNADLTGAKLYRTVARDALWIRASLKDAMMVSADLFQGILEKADLRGADMRGGNFYGANFALIRSDAETKAEDSIQDRVRTLPVRST